MIHLYDTLSRTIKELTSSDGKSFKCYCCGPTVYGPAHIGNFRTFLLQDVLRRTMEIDGLNPYSVRNITDVDDKTIRQSREDGISLINFTQKWTELFHKDCEELNILQPNVEPKATEHIEEQINLITQLVENNYAYVASDGSVYFKVSSFSDYGKLTKLDKRELQTQTETSGGATNFSDEYDRESVADFVLWKSRKPDDGDVFWVSPWGEGRPGWHLECSAMSMRYLGETFDLHGGGIDLCFPHHENEIAQSEAVSGKPFAHHWFHTAHLMVDGGKMSKSLGNLYTLEDIKDKGFSAMVLRYLLISGHYRQPLNFTLDSLHAAKSALNKIEKSVRDLLKNIGSKESEFQKFVNSERPKDLGFFEKAWESISHDLNTASCLGQIFSGLKILDAKIFAGISESDAIIQLKALGSLMYALGLNLFAEEKIKIRIPEEIKQLAEKRWQAKKSRDFSTADTLRDEIQSKGWKILDTSESYTIEAL